MKTLTKLASLAGVLVWAQAAAAARVEVLDCPKCPRSARYADDGTSATELSVPARRWVQDVSCRLNLSAGSHEVRIFNAKEAVPAIVQMTVR